jgi:NAD dependent epimerase/dehydratase family
MGIKAIITGSTGMVGEGVLHQCLINPNVDSVLVINRRPCGVCHPKLTEIIHKDFMNLSSIEDQLSGYNACYFCSGVSSVGKNEKEYTTLTYDLTLGFANTLVKLKSDMVFTYVSGVGTDETEKGKSTWARIKGKTENDLLKLPFKDSYMYRPGYIQPIKSLKNAYKVYFFFSPFYPLFEKLFPKYVGTLEEIGNSMIHVTLNGYTKKVLECVDIRKTGR